MLPTINHLIFSQLCQSFTAQLFSKQVAWLGLWLEVFAMTKISPRSINTWSFSPSGIVVGVDVVTGVRGVIKAGDLTKFMNLPIIFINLDHLGSSRSGVSHCGVVGGSSNDGGTQPLSKNRD